ncbi:hypothetical protein PghCCS26_46230 [Paenibacillus glycanilyticus]|uniref:Type II secretion system protein GspF domain-containing protein n=1 Tax=Paenibacillus glycanilyticus TaxID=126569 RepID=A0ABQ6NRQ8_9BACL|nr:hypothetical protein [Paenibacillus glycanilyticus]GMK47493.1 hypothetical protein PghCCS26_46230 [Paenibacillus glycanilyticus]
MSIMIMKGVLFAGVPAFGLLLMRELLYFFRRRSPPKLGRQFLAFVEQIRGDFSRIYADDGLDDAFAKAGSPFKISAWQYKLYRDLLFLVTVIMLHIQFMITHVYPLRGMSILAILYVITMTGKSFLPMQLLLRMAGKEWQSKKSNEIIDLFMLLLNEFYAESAEFYQNVISKLQQYRSHTKAIRPDLDQLLFEYTFDPKLAFKRFGERIGTKEAVTLSTLLEKINTSTPEMAIDLLETNYEAFLDFRRQRRRKKLKLNGYMAHATVLMSITVVINFMMVTTNVYRSILSQVQ